jgi:type I restriction enzyme, R subunit
VLVYRNHKLSAVEAKGWDGEMTEGVGQAKLYAGKMTVRFCYATNGRGIYSIDMQTGKEGDAARYPTPDELWALTFSEQNAWRDRFAAVAFDDKGGTLGDRYFRDIAIERVLESIATGKPRILLTWRRAQARP